MPDRPNILLIMTDQHRGDCIGADPDVPRDEDGRPLIHTPNIDSFVGEGALFTRAYTPAPSCIPARRSMMTGQTPATNGAPGWVTTPWDFEHTLPRTLRDAGYQTAMTGKIHSIPPGNHIGFEQMAQHEALFAHPNDDYTQWMKRESNGAFDEVSHGLGRNSWDPRPWHLDEHYHPTNWTTNRALTFLEERDETRPFFLNLSYVRPHTPFDPPQVYWDLYEDRPIPDPYHGEWAESVYGPHVPEYPPIDAWVADLAPTIVRRARIGYYGLITHIDHQIKRIIDALRVAGELERTFILFVSDHGEMLGDHYLWRKTYAYEGSARVPLVIRPHDGMDRPSARLIDRPVGLEDVMPTLLSVAGVSIPETVEGANLLELARDPEGVSWRTWYHGEHAPGSYHPTNGTQYVIDGRLKFIWNPVTGRELLFDLDEDPGEERDLAGDEAYRDDLNRAREALIARLDGRPEGFVEGGSLHPEGPGMDDVGDADDCAAGS